MDRIVEMQWRKLVIPALMCSKLAWAKDRVGDIEFFGTKGIDMVKVRNALPIKKGDAHRNSLEGLVRRALTPVAGEPTDVAGICCDENGDYLFFIGLRGESTKATRYNPRPTGNQALPGFLVRLSGRRDKAIEAAVRKGGSAAEEDDSNGYALINDPPARKLQLEVRRWVLGHEREVREVLESSANDRQRRIASEALGYANPSPAQIDALVKASGDPDSEVRNNAARALGVLVQSKRVLASSVRPDVFIAMLGSGAWTDRNKGAALLAVLTAERPAALLQRIRAEQLGALREMAAWRRSGHAFFARVLLGRVVGLREEGLAKLAWEDPAAILKAAEALPSE